LKLRFQEQRDWIKGHKIAVFSSKHNIFRYATDGLQVDVEESVAIVVIVADVEEKFARDDLVYPRVRIFQMT